ncbi:DUF2400 domain-containing protein [Cellulophaga sp. E16_2]|nr:DUF2400 domain-containing protein [Cellulophaga sp. E16_2]
MKKADLKIFLDEKVIEYNKPTFLDTDPIQIPHTFSQKEDIEISAFLTATIAWGNRKSIITNAKKMMALLDNSPHDFILNHQEEDLARFDEFVHRTFNGEDLKFFITSLQNIYLHHGGLEAVFKAHISDKSLQPAISGFKKVFFEIPHPSRTTKHVSDPMKGSAAKRINMFLRS